MLELVCSLPCQQCGREDQVQAAHTNWGHGKGRAIKADDNMVAALCQPCHAEIDYGQKLSKLERQNQWAEAHYRTIQALVDGESWPDDVPLPASYLMACR